MHATLIVFLFVLGACIGSFLNVVIYRLPRGESIVFPGSHCPRCGRGIHWYDNIPLVSWLALRAKCRFCKTAISPRYFVIELLTAVLVTGLYVCYYVLDLRYGPDSFLNTWPTFTAYALLLCGLLAASAVDIELFIVPLPVMWVCAAIGVAAAAYNPTSLMPKASPAAAVTAVGAVLGLLLANVLLQMGVLQPSFINADLRPAAETPPAPDPAKGKGKSKHKASQGKERPDSVAITSAHGVNPRIEVLRELLFLAPAIVLGGAALAVFKTVPAVAQGVNRLLLGDGAVATHLASGLGAVVGLLAGIAWLWGTRIFGTLLFGKEAMGMGDVHILAAVGAVAGWKVATLVFFAAPVFGLIWALYLLAFKGKRELPYGPWLAFATGFVLIFYDAIFRILIPV